MKCLDYAIAHDWRGFHCNECPVEDEYTRDELIEMGRGAFGGDPEDLFDALGEKERDVSEKDDRELTLDEAATLLGTSKNWCVRLGNKGEIRMRKGDDAQPLFERASLEAFKAAKGSPGAAPVPNAVLDPLIRLRLLVQCEAMGVLTREEAWAKLAAMVA